MRRRFLMFQTMIDEPAAPSVDDCIIDPQYPVEAYF
jgi:hypothetical protein